jgi:glucosamine-6-phosphate deaminase
MSRKISRVAEAWWDYTTLDEQIQRDAAKLSVHDIQQLSRPGFKVVLHDTLESFYLAEALQYINAWKESTPQKPAGICGPIGPTEQLPLVAQLVNDLDISLKHAHFWGMDEWFENGKSVDVTHPLSFARANHELLFSRIKPHLQIPDENIHYPSADNLQEYSDSFNAIRCLVMQGGQGDAKHWAFNDPFKREGAYLNAPPTPSEYRSLGTRVVELHPITLMQNARTSGGGFVVGVPLQALTVGPKETWKAGKVSIWQAGNHDNAFGMRLTAFMISKKIEDTSVPMSLLASHPDVEFHYYRYALKDVVTEMH